MFPLNDDDLSILARIARLEFDPTIPPSYRYAVARGMVAQWSEQKLADFASALGYPAETSASEMATLIIDDSLALEVFDRKLLSELAAREGV